MVLSDLKIKEEIRKGNIKISEFDESRLNPNSYNLRLDNKLKVYEDEVLDMKGENKARDIIIPEEGYILLPGRVYIASTVEYTETLGDLVPVLEGRSSIGRLGIFTHVTAGWGDTGFKGKWTLEIVVAQPVKIYAGIDICQIVYHRVDGKVGQPYNGKYQNQQGAETSRLYKDFHNKEIDNGFNFSNGDGHLRPGRSDFAQYKPEQLDVCESKQKYHPDCVAAQNPFMSIECAESRNNPFFNNQLEYSIRNLTNYILLTNNNRAREELYTLLSQYDPRLLVSGPIESEDIEKFVNTFVKLMQEKGVYNSHVSILEVIRTVFTIYSFETEPMCENETPVKKDNTTTYKSRVIVLITNNWIFDKESLSNVLEQIEVLIKYIFEEEYSLPEEDSLWKMIYDYFGYNNIYELIKTSANSSIASNRLIARIRAEI